MAASGEKNKKKKTSGFGWLLFWLAFLIGVTLLFVINREKVQNSLAVLKELISKQDAPPGAEDPAGPGADGPDAGAESAEQPPAGTQPPDAPDVTAAAPPDADTSSPSAAKTVKRQVYLIRLDNDGGLVAARVERDLPSSDSPMRDALEAVIKGPSADESKRNLLSLIPGNARILGATVRGSTAYIDFSEDFLFNTYGIEGYAGQLRQVVWTATEFGNVKDVQILVDGKRIDYLGEGIWIGSPLSRDSL
ncbi:MAG: GerMN domain-containing protein [Treponema sp.]|nr:GerMN domain-containing protein [Treponema sp.]